MEVEYSIEYPNSIILPYGMNMEKNFKMAGLSAKNIPYGIHGIHMELAWIPPGFHPECGGTVKTSMEGTLGKKIVYFILLAKSQTNLDSFVQLCNICQYVSNSRRIYMFDTIGFSLMVLNH